ncbi:glycosyltransferase family 4 protein [soil metagenome]
MRILHVSTIREWRGGDNQMLTTYNILKGHPELSQVILCPENSVLLQKCKDEGIPVYSAPKNSKFSLVFLKTIIRVIKKENIDVLHVHDSTALTLSLLALRFLSKVKLVYSRKRNNRIKSNFFKKLKYNNPRITRIVCVSQAVKDVLLPVLKNPEKAIVIYDGIDVNKFANPTTTPNLRREYRLKPDSILIGNIAGLTRQKDLFTFLDAAEIILKDNEDINFVIVGEGPLGDELKDHAIKLGISDRVFFAGFRKEIPSILAEFDIFLISSETEGLPLSVMEAFAAKVPVVATNAGGTGEAVKHGITGMISPTKEAGELAINTKELLQNPTLRASIIENAFELVQENFTLQVMEKEYLAFYKSLQVSEGSPRL